MERDMLAIGLQWPRLIIPETDKFQISSEPNLQAVAQQLHMMS